MGIMDHLRKVGDPVTGKPIGTTLANLEAAIAGERIEYTSPYSGIAATTQYSSLLIQVVASHISGIYSMCVSSH